MKGEVVLSKIRAQEFLDATVSFSINCRDITLAQETGVHYHCLSVFNKEERGAVCRAKSQGLH